MRDYSPKNWLYVLLSDVFHRKEEFEDPLGKLKKFMQILIIRKK